jgi:hypothetical protein
VQLIQFMFKKKQIKIELTEMFMAKASKDRCFFGIIKRWTDNDVTPKLFSKICMPNDGFICAQATNQKELGNNLDEMCVMILDMGLHDNAGVTTEIFGTDFFLN